MQVGLDVGYSATKAVTGRRRVTFPSAVGTPDRARFSLSEDERIVLLSPENVLVGEGAITQSRFVQRREDRRWIESGEWYSLFLAAVTELTAATLVELRLVTGLPVAFYDDRQKVRDRLLGTHKVQREGRRCQRVEVQDARVIPQPFGALLAATLDRQGRIVDEGLASGAVGVVDVGGKTTNLLSVIRLREIGRETASVSVGAWDAVRGLRRWLERKCPGLELRDHAVIEAMIARETRYYGERVDLGPAVEEILEPLAEQVVAQITQVWNGAAGLDGVLVSGGGALLLGPYVERAFRHARVVEQPVFANAEGFWRFAERVARGS